MSDLVNDETGLRGWSASHPPGHADHVVDELEDLDKPNATRSRRRGASWSGLTYPGHGVGRLPLRRLVALRAISSHERDPGGEEVVFVPRRAAARLGGRAGERGQGPAGRRDPGSHPPAQAGEGQAVKQDGKPPKAAYGIRLDGERYQLDGQPPVAQPTKAWAPRWSRWQGKRHGGRGDISGDGLGAGPVVRLNVVSPVV
jgi:hypothetical protein